MPGDLWSIVVGVDFFLLSNPLSLIADFDDSLRYAVLVTLGMCVLHLPWLRLPVVPVSVVLFMAWATSSLAWSIDPSATREVLWIYVQVALLAAVVAANVAPSAIVQGIAWGGVAIVVASLIALEKELPGAAVPMGGEGYMAGVGTNRNILAYTLVLALCFLVSSSPRTWEALGKWFAALTVVLVGILLSSSGTGTVSAGAALLTAGAVRAWGPVRRRLGGRSVAWLWGPALAAGVGLVLGYNQIVALLGRDGHTLSGRVPLWEAVVDVTTGHVAEGYGWGAVWIHPWAPAPDNDAAASIYEGAGLVLAHGHNSWFDLYPEVGIVGVLLAAAIYGQVWFLAARRPTVRAERATFARLAVVVLVGHLIFGLTEPLVTIPLGWFLLVLVAGMAVRMSAPRPLARWWRRRAERRARRYRGKRRQTTSPRRRAAGLVTAPGSR